MSLRDRKRLAASELLMELATTTERWARQVEDRDEGTLPFAQWPAEDPLAAIARQHQLTPAQLAHVLRRIGGLLEARALKSGYDSVDTDAAPPGGRP